MMKQLFSITCAAVLLFSGFAPIASYAQDDPPPWLVFHYRLLYLLSKWFQSGQASQHSYLLSK